MKPNILKIIVIALLATVAGFANFESMKPEFVDTLLGPYFNLQASLAGDDLAVAKANGTKLQSAIAKGTFTPKTSSTQLI